MTRAERIEAAARELLGDIKIGHQSIAVRCALDSLRSALAEPAEPRSHRCINDGGDGYECPGCNRPAEPQGEPPRFPATVEGAKALMAWKAEHPEFGAPSPSPCPECCTRCEGDGKYHGVLSYAMDDNCPACGGTGRKESK